MALKNKEKNNFALIMIVYLLGIFMGALDTGIVTPARTVIQDSLGVNDSTGIWLVTIYTLAYASSIPVLGKLADRMGRRTVYLLAILLFGGGSFMCGIAHSLNSFTALLIARAVQAIGGGGIVPVANAEFGTTFPEEKRGMALGMVGGVYGIANIFGASAGSLILDLFGTDRWEYIFFVNVPIAVFILIAGFFSLPNNKEKATSKLDGMGTAVLVVMVLCIMYGLKNIDFFDFIPTVTSTKVYPFLIAFCALLPVFVFVEKRAEDPVMNLKYFTNPRVIITLLVSIITGIVLMGVIFIPQLCENAMEVPTGSGGYFVIALGLCAGIGAPFSGRLTDKFGPKLVLGFGLLASILGSLVIINFTTVAPNRINVFGALMLIGLGIGFTMGAPLNYMMLSEVPDREANSALATLSLVRSLGTVVAPAIMVGFIVHAAAGIQDNLMAVLPTEVNMPKLPYAEELTKAAKDQGVKGMPDLDKMTSMEISMDNMSGGENNEKMELPDELLAELQGSDVTTITDSVVHLSEYFFDQMSPKIQAKINDGIDQGVAGIDGGIEKMDATIAEMRAGQDGIQQGIDGISDGLNKQSAAVKKMKKARAGIEKGYDGIGSGINGITKGINGIDKGIAGIDSGASGIQSAIDGIKAGMEQIKPVLEMLKQMESGGQPGTGGTSGGSGDSGGAGGTSGADGSSGSGAAGGTSDGSGMPGGSGGSGMPGGTEMPTVAELEAQLASMQAQVDQMESQVESMEAQKSTMKSKKSQMIAKRKTMKAQQAKMKKAIKQMNEGIKALNGAMSKMKAARSEMYAQKAKLGEAISGIESGQEEMRETKRKMNVLKDAVPGAFEKAEEDYIQQVRDKDPEIRKVYQETLGVGFKQMYMMTGITSGVGILLLLLYRRRKPQEEGAVEA